VSFFSHVSLPVVKGKGSRFPLLPYKHQPYCWQVSLQQSLFTLQVNNGILNLLTEKITNYFWQHCQFN